MGDDLTAARRFCDTVRSDMTSLMDGVCAQPCAAPDVLVGSLVRIQSGAKRIHARAIFRAAQTVVNAVNDRVPLPAVQGRVLSLNKLITQYECGLEDIAPRPANSENVLVAPPVGALEYATDQPPMPDIDARFRAARAALAPLMSFANPGVERVSLTQLAGFLETELNTSKLSTSISDVNLDVSHGEAIEPNELMLSPIEQTPETKFTPNVFAQPVLQIDFEMLMPNFISQTLQEARQSDKTVSVSYAAEGVTLPQNQMTALQSIFAHIAKMLVGSVLERPETRRERGESGAGHIAVTAVHTGDLVAISIECPGQQLPVTTFMPAGVRAEGLIITPGANASDALCHIVLTLPRKGRTLPIASPNTTEMAS